MTVGWAFFTWYNVVVFPITEGPRWTRGFTANICLVVVWVSLFMVGYILWQRDIRRGLYKDAIQHEEEEETSEKKGAEAAPDVTYIEEEKPKAAP